jgi:16S rRNA (adenine(1408)-N(1))-methyltransferase
MARRHRRVHIDLGTGDGRAAIAVAAADAGTLVLAIDADARSMTDASRRAAARPERGGLPNLMFLAEGVERLPAAFDGLADQVTLLFPWGSLLRGALGLDPAISASIARLVAPGGRLEMVLSVVERDRIAVGGAGEGPFGATDVEALTRTFAGLGFIAVTRCRLSPDEIRATGSTWARRLGSDPARPVWRVDLCRH